MIAFIGMTYTSCTPEEFNQDNTIIRATDGDDGQVGDGDDDGSGGD